MTTLTVRQWLVYTFLVAYIRGNGYAPSNHEIAAHLGKQPGAGITHTMHKLAAKGVITLRGHNASRATTLVRGMKVGVEL